MVLIVLGPFMGHVISGNVLIFMIWLNAFSSAGWSTVEGQDSAVAKKMVVKYKDVPSCFHTFNIWFGIIMAASLAGAGWWCMAVLLTVSTIAEYNGKQKFGLIN
jgi:hypothetical protein